MTDLSEPALARLRAAIDLPDLSGTRYELIRRLDRGGMGTIYVVRDVELRRELAMKVLSAADPSGDLGARLLAEARHLARLEHPGIVPVHDVGQLPDGRLYYVMKLVRGRRLDAWRSDQNGRLALLRLSQKICAAVAFAHAQGIIHRDLKPENIMVGPFGEALVLDWGVAKAMREHEGETLPPGVAAAGRPSDGHGVAERGATADGALIGTPAYMAPEQARGEIGAMDSRADVYALGAILYFLMAGAPPFEGPSAREVLAEVRRRPPQPLRRIDPSIPRALEAIVARAMARAPEDRYGSAQELSDDIERFLDGLPVSAHRESVLERTTRVLDRNRALAWLVGAYVLMRALVLAFTGR